MFLFIFILFFFSKSLRKGYLFGQKIIERNRVGQQGWVSPCRWVAPTERRLLLDRRSENIIILHSVWASQKFNRWWWSFGFYNQPGRTYRKKSVVLYSTLFFRLPAIHGKKRSRTFDFPELLNGFINHIQRRALFFCFRTLTSVWIPLAVIWETKRNCFPLITGAYTRSPCCY